MTTHDQAPLQLSRAEAAELISLVAALSRAGLSQQRVWWHLARHTGPIAAVAAQVSSTVELGGPVPEALAALVPAVHGSGRDVVHWLSVAAAATHGPGAAAGAVYEGLLAGLRAELDQAGELEVAVAGPRATAMVLGLLPAVGLLLGTVTGSDVLGVLLFTQSGRACLLGGAVLWWVGRRWVRSLIASASR